MPLAEIFRDIFGKQKETNKVKILYDDAFKADIGRWIASCAVIGLAAGIISKNPSQGLLAAATYNLAVVRSHYSIINFFLLKPSQGALHFFAIKIPVKPKSMTDPRPPNWYSLLLAASTAMWLAALVVIFVKRDDISAYKESNHEKRRTGFIGEISEGAVSMLNNLTIACGCFGVCAL